MSVEMYENQTTHEVTDSHEIAMKWFNSGANIALWAKGTVRLTWEH